MNRKRRQFLQAFGAGSAGLLAGCSLNGGTSTDTETPRGDTPTDTPTDATPTPTATPTATPEQTTTAPQETTTEDGSDGSDGIGPNTLIIQEAGGADIWDATDRGHFFYDWVSGNFDVKVRVLSVENTDANAKGGIMARASMDADAAHVYVRRRPPGYIVVQWRPSKGAQARSLTSDAGADEMEFDGQIPADWQWMRLQRKGSTFKAFIGPDGEEWNLIAELGKSEVTLPEQTFLGLAATSHDRAAVTTVKYMGLQGVKPSKTINLGSPLKKGGVTVARPALVSAESVPSTSSSGATVQGRVESLGGADEVDVTIEYRELMADEWQQGGSRTVSETGTFSVDLSGLTARRYYQWRVVSDNGETQFSSSIQTFATKGSSQGTSEGPESAALHDLADGFTEVAPWLDDGTPIIKVREASANALKRAVGVNGPRVIVFETSGVIDLDGGLSVSFPQCYIAGQTAPSPGITLTRGQVTIDANDVVVQHVRSRPGDAGKSKADDWEPGAIDTTDGTKNVVIDHCSLSWAVDENVSVGYRSENTTLSNCLIAEPLNDSTHHEGAHGYTALVGDNSKNVAIMGNVMAFTTDRNPRLKEGNESVVVNNLVHYYGDGIMMGDDDGQPVTRASVVGNVYEKPQTDQPAVFAQGSSGPEAYLDDNVIKGGVSTVGDTVTRLGSRPLWPEGMQAAASGQTKAQNLQNAGARPADRSRVDQRIVENLRNGEGGVIDSQEEVGGYPVLFENKTSHDIPDTGLRAWLREQALAVEQSG
ncbi:MAG: pectate lyase [Haloarculaceae archaeon]